MGQGPVGLLFTALMKNFGAKRVLAVDTHDYRLEVARRMGADHIINPKSQNLEKAVADCTDGALADIAIDACGQNVGAINACFDVVRHNGQVAFFGICLEESPPLNFNVFFRKELRMISSVGPDLSIDYPFALDMIVKGAIDVSPLITHILPVEDIQKGFEMAAGRRDKVIKVILEF
jgi:threonine dehydrogenase-like Zn-dependent dehydrogenase